MLKVSPVLTWKYVPGERNAVADVMMQAVEKHGAGGRDKDYKDSKIG